MLISFLTADPAGHSAESLALSLHGPVLGGGAEVPAGGTILVHEEVKGQQGVTAGVCEGNTEAHRTRQRSAQ